MTRRNASPCSTAPARPRSPLDDYAPKSARRDPQNNRHIRTHPHPTCAHPVPGQQKADRASNSAYRASPHWEKSPAPAGTKRVTLAFFPYIFRSTNRSSFVLSIFQDLHNLPLLVKDTVLSMCMQPPLYSYLRVFIDLITLYSCI